MKLFMTLLLVLSPAAVFAAGDHGDAIPTKTIIYQFINVGALVIGLIYFTKDAAISFFKSRKSDYLAAAEKSAFAREQAEKEFVDIKNKLNELDSTRADSLSKAKAHADDIKAQIIEEANAVTKRIKDDAQLTAKLEVERAQKDLRTQLLTDSVAAARLALTKDLGANDQQKLQKDFINHVGV